jgi:hypothetical protein
VSKDERPVIQLEDGEGNRLHAVWSRSWKHLILSVVPRGKWHEASQIELDGEQLKRLATFLQETRPIGGIGDIG